MIETRTTNSFDAAGRRVSVKEENWREALPGRARWYYRWQITQDYDGDGQRIRQLEDGAESQFYYVRSSALGGAVVGEIKREQSVWIKDGYVYALGQMIAQQKQNSNGTNEVRWNYTNPITGAQRGAIQSEPNPLG